MHCSTCGRMIDTEKGWVSFSCPQCGKTAIFRCSKCRTFGNPYTCGECKFVGP